MNLSKKIGDVFLKNRFAQGVITGLVLHRAYDYVQSSVYTNGDKLARYDKNGDGKISVGEIVDGVIEDVSNINKNAKSGFDPEDVFTLKKDANPNNVTKSDPMLAQKSNQ